MSFSEYVSLKQVILIFKVVHVFCFSEKVRIDATPFTIASFDILALN